MVDDQTNASEAERSAQASDQKASITKVLCKDLGEGEKNSFDWILLCNKVGIKVSVSFAVLWYLL